MCHNSDIFRPILLCMISGFRHKVDENCTLLGCYAVKSGNSLQTFWDNLSDPSSRLTTTTSASYG